MNRGLLQVPARSIPVPTSVSAEAQAILAMGPMSGPEYPALDDAAGWHKMISSTDEMMLAMFGESGLTSPAGCRVDELSIDGISVFAVTPPDLDAGDSRVYLDVHGGAFIVGAGEVCRAMGIMTACKVGMRVWSVDYRMPPDHPYPAAVDDCVAVYRALVGEHW